jgi:sugar (pentulose or hexulose) kinase
MSVAVLDIGKTNLKLVVVDAAGRTLHHASRPNLPLAGPPYPHADVEGILGWCLEALAATPDRAAIDTLVPVTHGCCAALVADDQLALPVLDYEHDGPDATGAAFASAADPFAESRSPTLPLGFTLGRQIYWQARTFPKPFGRVTDILMYPQYWAWRLTGVKAAEVTSLGCHTGLWRPAARTYSRLVEREGWLTRMPPLRPAWAPLGPPLSTIAAATGLSPDCRVLCGVHDSNASYLAHLATRRAPFAVLSSGTWLIVMAASADLARLDAARDMLANVDVNGDPVPTARFMGGREFAAVAGPDSSGVQPDLAVASRLIARGTMALPSFAPESGPFIGRTGSLVGPPPDGPAERVALASLYNALVADLMLELLGAKGPRIVEGPFAGNPVFLAALAGLQPDWPVIASTDASGTSAGAALLAAWPPKAPAAGEGPGAKALLQLATYRAAWRARLT